MANEQNLQPCRTTEEAKERGRNGGLKSVEARRRKRTLKQIAELLADEPINITYADGKKRDVTYDVALVVSQYRKAIKYGDTRSAQFIAELLGDLKQRVELDGGGLVINVNNKAQEDAVNAILTREQ